MKERVMESIFTYTDYPAFLKDYIHEKKLNSNGFSFKVIADRAGFKARDYILRVMNGSRIFRNPACACCLRLSVFLKKKPSTSRTSSGSTRRKNQRKRVFL